MPAEPIRAYADACVFIAFVGNEEAGPTLSKPFSMMRGIDGSSC